MSKLELFFPLAGCSCFTFMCLSRLDLVVASWLQIWQRNLGKKRNYSAAEMWMSFTYMTPSCLFWWWTFNPSLEAKSFPQMLQGTLSPECLDSLCLFRFPVVWALYPHSMQGNLPSENVFNIVSNWGGQIQKYLGFCLVCSYLKGSQVWHSLDP